MEKVKLNRKPPSRPEKKKRNNKSKYSIRKQLKREKERTSHRTGKNSCKRTVVQNVHSTLKLNRKKKNSKNEPGTFIDTSLKKMIYIK